MPKNIDSIRLTKYKAKNSYILEVPKDNETIDCGCLKLNRKMRALFFFGHEPTKFKTTETRFNL